MGIVRQFARVVLTLNVLFALLLGYSYVFGDLDAESQVAMTLAAIPVVLSFLGASLVIAVDWDPI